MQIFNQFEGYLFLFVYAFLVFVITYIVKKGKANKLSFLVANRKIPGGLASFSIAASWIWAPALFIASQKAYTQGMIGLFWFTVPNVLCLVIFGLFAVKLRKRFPNGFTFSDWVRKKYSNRTHNLYLLEGFGLQTLSFAVQLLAGASILHAVTGIPFFIITIILAIIPFVYIMLDGIRASITTDFWQMLWIAFVVIAGTPFLIQNAEMGNIVKGFSGITGLHGDILSSAGWKIFLSFGLPATIGLMAGPFGDQQFFQRVYSIKKNGIKKAFMWGALIFAVVPIFFGTWGFAVAGNGIEVADTQLTNLEAVINFMPSWFLIPFMFVILSGLVSTLDSASSAVSSYVGHDLVERIAGIKDSVKMGRLGIIVVSILALGIANIPNMTILYLWLFYGVMRASVLLPTVWLGLGKKMSESGLFWGLLGSMLIGLPIFTYGRLSHKPLLVAGGTIFVVLFSGIMSRLAFSKKK